MTTVRMTPPDSSLLSNLSLEVRSGRPLYAQLADELRGLVEARFDDGDLFYSEKTLIGVLPVSQITIRRALRELAAEGLLMPGRGRGTTIRKKARPAQPPSESGTHGGVRQTPPARRQGRATKRILGIFLHRTIFDLSEHSMALMHEFQRQSDARGIEIRFHDTSDTARLSQIFRSVSDDREEEAFVLHTPSDLTHLLYHALDNRGYRSVAMEGIGPDYPGQVVATDPAAVVQIGMDYLLVLGHRRIVLLVNEPATEFNVQDKLHAFQQYVSEHGLDSSCRVVQCDNVIGSDAYDAAYAHMDEAVNGGPVRPTAIFTVSDLGAWAATKWCAQHEILVPGEVSVLGFEDARSDRYMHPAISSVAHPDAHLIECTLDMLWGSGGDMPRRILIAPTLVIRESTAPPPWDETVQP